MSKTNLYPISHRLLFTTYAKVLNVCFVLFCCFHIHGLPDDDDDTGGAKLLIDREGGK